MSLAKSMTKEMMREIGNKSREFYEFILPPVDMILEEEKLAINIDLPGFNKKDIRITLNGNILSINAEKEPEEKTNAIICNQRPRIIDKKIRLPIDAKEVEENMNTAKYDNGVLSLVIPIKKSGKDIHIE